ncbi:MAG: hypothetical protein KGZ43_11475 [Sulfuritalea sp.]|nr:hypothetical protein [Sulfuritalea sp.]
MPTEKFDSTAFLAALTEAPGVYRMLAADGAALYVGKAKNCASRAAMARRSSSRRGRWRTPRRFSNIIAF